MPGHDGRATLNREVDMILSGVEIQRLVHLTKVQREAKIWTPEQQGIVIEPFDPKQLNPNSYNVRLGRKLKVYELPLRDRGLFDQQWPPFSLEPRNGPIHAPFLVNVLDMARPNPTKMVEIPRTGIILFPGVLYLACTEEYTETYGLVPMLEGRSSVGRLGVTLHVTAGFGDVGFKGRWTCEMTVVHPVRVYAGVQIGQLVYEEVSRDHVAYGKDGQAKYLGDGEPVESKLWKEFQPQEAPHE